MAFWRANSAGKTRARASNERSVRAKRSTAPVERNAIMSSATAVISPPTIRPFQSRNQIAEPGFGISNWER